MMNNSTGTSHVQMNTPISRKRGRPKLKSSKKDLGTPELIMKKLHDYTTEPLDLCLERKIIVPDQHWCGMHLRWLYTLRWGTPCARTSYQTYLGNHDMRTNDPEFRMICEKEYVEAVKMLSKEGYTATMMDLCVYNICPPFLLKNALFTKKMCSTYYNETLKIKSGLDCLVGLWVKRHYTY